LVLTDLTSALNGILGWIVACQSTVKRKTKQGLNFQGKALAVNNRFTKYESQRN
jgi:hypothetical protein